MFALCTALFSSRSEAQINEGTSVRFTTNAGTRGEGTVLRTTNDSLIIAQKSGAGRTLLAPIGYGAAIGAFIPTEKWTKVDLRPTVSLRSQLIGLTFSIPGTH